MAYVYLIIVTILFSFGGMLIKVTGTAFSPYLISFFRFVIGAGFLIAIQKWKTGKVSVKLTGRFLWIGGICKAIHYLGENYGVIQGYSYGNVVIWPVQTLIILAASILVLKEKISPKKMIGTFLCVAGIGVISWNGMSLESFFGGQAILLIVFAAAGTGAALFSFSQKELLQQMDPVEINLSMFLIGGGSCSIFLPFQKNILGEISGKSIVTLMILGAITGIGFLLQAEAMKKIPLFLVTVIQSSTVIFSLFWAATFFHEPITAYVIIGTAIFLTGMLLIQVKIPQGKSKTAY